MLTHPDLQRSLEAIDDVASRFGGPDLERQPPRGWSVAQILEHLGKAYGSTAYILEKCVADGRARGRAPSLTQRIFATLIIDVGYFPRGVRAPEVTVPTGMGGDEAVAFARTQLHALDTAATRCLGHFGPRVRVANHPILGGFTVPQWQRFHWRHTCHHARQIATRQT